MSVKAFNAQEFRRGVKRALLSGRSHKQHLMTLEGYKVSLFLGHVNDSGDSPVVYAQLHSGVKVAKYAADSYIGESRYGHSGRYRPGGRGGDAADCWNLSRGQYGAVLLVENDEHWYLHNGYRKALEDAITRKLRLTAVKVATSNTQADWLDGGVPQAEWEKIERVSTQVVETIQTVEPLIKELRHFIEAMIARDNHALTLAAEVRAASIGQPWQTAKRRTPKHKIEEQKALEALIDSKKSPARSIHLVLLDQYTAHIQHEGRKKSYFLAYDKVEKLLSLMGAKATEEFIKAEFEYMASGGSRTAYATAMVVHELNAPASTRKLLQLNS